MAGKPQIIGITGAFGSGKTSAANYFEKHGFKKMVLSSFLREILEKEGKMVTRENLQNLGNELRETKGSGYLTELALEYLEKHGIEKSTIDGIRNMGEIEVLRSKSNFILLGVVADRDTRFARIRKMPGREELTREDFERLDRRDLGLIEESESGLQVAKCLALSDIFVESNNEEEYPKKLEEVINKI